MARRQVGVGVDISACMHVRAHVYVACMYFVRAQGVSLGEGHPERIGAQG